MVSARPQARVDPVEEPLAQGKREVADQLLRDARKVFVVGAVLSGGRVEEEEVEVGVISELAAPQLAERDHHHGRVALSVALLDLRPCQREAGLDTGIGQIGQLARDLLDGQRAGHVVEGDAQHLLVAEAPQLGERRLHVGRGNGAQPVAQIGPQIRSFAHQGGRAAQHELIDELGMAQELPGQVIARSEERDQEPGGARALGQQLARDARIRQAAEQVGQVPQGLVRIRGRRKLHHQRRTERLRILEGRAALAR